MAEKKEQAKPLAPTTHRTIYIENHDDFPVEFTSRRSQKCIKCCGCSAAVSLILLVTLLVLMLTVLHVKDPLLKLNSVKIDGVDSLSGNPGRNLTLVADLSLKNPNAASFKFDNATTYVYYGGSVVGEVRTPSGRVGARRSIRMSVLVDLMVDRVVEVKRFGSDLSRGILGIRTYTRVSGKVKVTSVSKKNVVVEMKCSMNVNVSRQAIEDRVCGTSVSI